MVHYSMQMILCFWLTQEWSFKACGAGLLVEWKMKFKWKNNNVMVVGKGGRGLKWKLMRRRDYT